MNDKGPDMSGSEAPKMRYVTHDDFMAFSSEIKYELAEIRKIAARPLPVLPVVGLLVSIVLGIGAIAVSVGIATVGGSWVLMQNTVTGYDALRRVADQRLDDRTLRLERLQENQDARLRDVEYSRFTGEEGAQLAERVNELEVTVGKQGVEILAVKDGLHDHEGLDAHPWAAAQHNAGGERDDSLEKRIDDLQRENKEADADRQRLREIIANGR